MYSRKLCNGIFFLFCINFSFWPQKSPKKTEPRKKHIWELKSLEISIDLSCFASPKALGLPRWLNGKEYACWSKRCRFNLWVRKIPWRRKWQLLPVLLPGKFHWFLLGELISELIPFHVDHFKSLYWLFYKWLLFYVLVSLLWGMWDLSFPNKDQTHIPCIGRWGLKNWTAREVPLC